MIFLLLSFFFKNEYYSCNFLFPFATFLSSLKKLFSSKTFLHKHFFFLFFFSSFCLLLYNFTFIQDLFFVKSQSTRKKVSVSEATFDSAVDDIQWFGKDHQKVIMKTVKGKIYRSKDSGKQWSDITTLFIEQLEKLGKHSSFVAESIMVNAINKNIVLVIGSKKNHFISDDGTLTFRHLNCNSTIHSWHFHPSNSNMALLSTWSDECFNKSSKAKGNKECNHMLYATKDLGKSFKQVVDYVVQFSWGDKKLNLENRIYFSHHVAKFGAQPRYGGWSQHIDFSYTDDFGLSSKLLVHEGNKFLISNGYIFVAKLDNALKQTVKMLVSTDGGDTFNLAKLPTEIQEKSYTVLDTSEGAIILHVNHGENSNTGSVYISDEKGLKYSLSLPNNIRTISGECEFDKVLSLEGVYIANFKDDLDIPRNTTAQEIISKMLELKEEDFEDEAFQTALDKKRKIKAKGRSLEVIRTVITFDKGGVWSYLKPPKVDSVGKAIQCPKNSCWLHLHGITNFHQYAPYYSVENAVGLIIATGNVGSHLKFEPDEVNTYMSRDGGLTWVEAHKGAYVYEFGDHGGLIVMADDLVKTNQIVFSWNEGQTWYDFELSKFPIEVDNIVIEPNSSTIEFMVYGTRDDAGVLVHLDFGALGQNKCNGVWAADSVSSDYETWTPSDGRSGDRCILGRQIVYTRRKSASECFHGQDFSRPITKKNCACTIEDYECEFGFARRVGSFECKPEDPSLTAEGCTTSSYFYTDAYRSIPGDTCEGGWKPPKVAVPCPSHAPFSRGAKAVLLVILTVATSLFTITFVLRNPKMKHFFKNYGYESFANVKYSVLGIRQPDTAIDMSSCKYEPELGFIDSEQDEHEEDAPTLMSYSADRFSTNIAQSAPGSSKNMRQFDLEHEDDSKSNVDTFGEKDYFKDFNTDYNSAGLKSTRLKDPAAKISTSASSSNEKQLPRIPLPASNGDDFGSDGLELI